MVLKTAPKRHARREVRVRVPTNSGLARFFLGPVGRILVIGLALFIILGLGAFTFFYAKYSRLIDQKLLAGPFANTSKIFAAPEIVAVGDASKIRESLGKFGTVEEWDSEGHKK